MPKRENRKGYHYTSYEAWLSIQKDGMMIHPITMPSIQRYFDKPLTGIWIWPEPLTGESELGMIILEISLRQNTKIVLLEIEYDEPEILKYRKGHVVAYHHGSVNDWVFHDLKVAYILVNPIPPERIRLLKVVDAMDLVSPDLGISVEDSAGVGEDLH